MVIQSIHLCIWIHLNYTKIDSFKKFLLLLLPFLEKCKRQFTRFALPLEKLNRWAPMVWILTVADVIPLSNLLDSLPFLLSKQNACKFYNAYYLSAIRMTLSWKRLYCILQSIFCIVAHMCVCGGGLQIEPSPKSFF